PGGDPASAGANAGAYPGGDPASAGANAGAYPGANAGSAAGANPGEATATGYPGAEGASGGGAYPGAGAGPGQGGGAVASAKPPEGLEGKAYWSFKRGKDADAMKYLYAYGLSDDQGAQSVLSTIRWVPGLKRPSLAVRFGAGVQVTAPPTFKGDPKALGSTQKLPTRGGGGGRGGEGGFGDAGAGAEGAGGFGGEGGYGPGGFAGGGGGGGGGKAAGINPVLARNTGDLGEKLVAAYKERLMRGDYGAVLKKAAGEAPAPSGGGAGAYGAEAAGAQAGFGGGKFAGGYPGGGAGAGGGAQAGGGDVAQIAPGLTMLGVGSQKELLAKAKEAGVDVFLLFKVSIKPNPKTRLVINEASFALLDAKTGQSLADAKTRKKLPPSRKLTNMDVQKSRAAGKDDGIDREVDKLFAFVDANLKMVDLPAALNAENVLKRVGSLIAKPVDDKLPVLSEIRMYNVKGLLQDAHLSKAYEKVLGVDFGRMLATGTDEDKHKVVQRWLPDA
ncbi:MAG: hypothetical protein CMJ64_11685, partial [Planctomycetaceae bacterium]|nr:hypothetical protein [Planctomycetaceae bacterium]